MYKYVLIPGRHHLISNYQVDYFRSLLAGKKTVFRENKTIKFDQNPKLIWAITSVNHSNTRRNPIAGIRRLGMVEKVMSKTGLNSLVFGITNIDQKNDFAHYLIEEINIQSRGNTQLSPDNCVVATSTPSIIEQFQALGYKIAPIELKDDQTISTARTWDIIEKIIDTEDWENDKEINSLLHIESKKYLIDYCLDILIKDVFKDPLTLDDGDITDTRDYETYRAAFEDNAFRKVNDFIDFVEPGRILDIGCATGQTIKLLTNNTSLFESDFYGVEIARPLYQICENRKNNGEFGTSNVFFYQRNIMNSDFFENNSLNTIITMALTHEIESYMGRQKLHEFLKKIYDMLLPGGIYINYDVTGPSVLDEEVFVIFNKNDGENPDDLRLDIHGHDLSNFLKTLSSEARFLKFVSDFRKEENDGINPYIVDIGNQSYYKMKWSELCEFLAKKDYTDSWHSEMHEKFCFWNINNWRSELEKVGFTLETSSRPIKNQWLIDNRFNPAAKVYKKDSTGNLIEQEIPDTNVMIIARK